MKEDNEVVFLTLSEWNEKRYGGHFHPNTLRNWVKNGLIYPQPIKHGRAFMVRSDAKYYDIKTGELV